MSIPTMEAKMKPTDLTGSFKSLIIPCDVAGHISLSFRSGYSQEKPWGYAHPMKQGCASKYRVYISQLPRIQIPKIAPKVINQIFQVAIAQTS
jgi:hypothetical protein